VSLDAGQLPERIRFERYNDAIDDWAPIAVMPEVWAGVDALGDELYRIRLRYRPDLVGFKDATPTVRVLWLATSARPSDRVLDIIDVSEVDRRQQSHISARGRLIESVNLASGARRRTPWPR
jgi:hypothetical protein